MIHPFLAHWKAEVAISSIVLGIGLVANEVTSPKVLAVMVFLSDWSMAGTLEWSLRLAIYAVIAGAVYWRQKVKNDRQVAALRKELDFERIERQRLSSSYTELLRIASGLLPRDKLPV